jgi:signal transduction histidine kinase
MSKYGLALILIVTGLLLSTGLYMGYKSAEQMRQIVRDDFNQQQLVLARHTASLMEQDINFLKRELTTLNLSASIQYLEKLTWANRIRVTFSSVREDGVIQIRRINQEGNRAYLVDDKGLEHEISGSFGDAPYLEWARNPANRGHLYIGPVQTQVPNYVGRLIMEMAIPTYEESVDESHPHPPGTWAGVLVFYIDVHYLANKFTSNIQSGKTGYAWIMDNTGTFLNHPEHDFIGKNAFTVRKERMSAISFDAINEIQREKMLTGQEGWGTYISGWHKGLAGEIPKLIAYAPVKLTDTTFVQSDKPLPTWSVAVVAPASEVEGVIHSVYQRHFFLQVLIGVFVLFGSVFMLNFRYERQFTTTLEAEVNRQRKELQKSEARYQGLIENAADLIYTVNLEGQILSINRFAVNFFSRSLGAPYNRKNSRDAVTTSADLYLGKTFYDVMSKKTADFHMDWLEEIKNTGRAWSKRHQVNIGDREFWFSTSIVGLKDEQGQTFAYEIISRDITSRKSIEDRLNTMEKLASVGTLAAGVAHEINNPIAIILGFTEILLEQTGDYPDVHETLKIIEEEGFKCKKIVENLLTFARTPEKIETNTNINDTLQHILAIVKNTLLIKKIRLEDEFAPDLPRGKGDPRELEQVFINIINNAMGAMKGGGLLKVSTRLASGGKKIAIEFSDTGTGIPKESQPKIFDPFFTTKTVGEGTGLGLSMGYGIITKFGGDIKFTSYPEEEYPDRHGTTFTVLLPVVAATENEPVSLVDQEAGHRADVVEG